ncbi:MAG TPA: hypothetical protein VFB36_00920 [Nevskiaceae bacterium]|nr:hypothetical protein [Nevskiaceae bacterium]
MKRILLALAALLPFSASAAVNCDQAIRLDAANKLVGGKWFSTSTKEKARGYVCGYSLTGGGGELVLTKAHGNLNHMLKAGTMSRLSGIGKSASYFKDTPKGETPVRGAHATAKNGDQYLIELTLKKAVDDTAVKTYLVDTLTALAGATPVPEKKPQATPKR